MSITRKEAKFLADSWKEWKDVPVKHRTDLLRGMLGALQEYKKKIEIDPDPGDYVTVRAMELAIKALEIGSIANSPS